MDACGSGKGLPSLRRVCPLIVCSSKYDCACVCIYVCGHDTRPVTRAASFFSRTRAATATGQQAGEGVHRAADVPGDVRHGRHLAALHDQLDQCHPLRRLQGVRRVLACAHMDTLHTVTAFISASGCLFVRYYPCICDCEGMLLDWTGGDDIAGACPPVHAGFLLLQVQRRVERRSPTGHVHADVPLGREHCRGRFVAMAIAVVMPYVDM